MAKGITLKDKNGGTLYPKTVADLVLDSETGEPIGKVITSMGKIKADEEKKWLRVEGEEGKRYFVALTKLEAPNAPTIATTTYNVVKGSFDIEVTNNTTGATMKYKIGESGSWTTIVNRKITYDTGYDNDKDNVPIENLKIYLKAINNGEESDVNEVSITIKPKVASGTISVRRNGNDNAYSTQATITITKSTTKDAVTRYQENGGTWTELGGESKTFTRTATTDSGYYNVKATRSGYTDSDVSSNGAFTLGKKKFYYGRGPEILSGEGAIMALTGGGVIEKDTMAGNYEITSTEKGLYTWFCGTGTLTSVTSGGFAVPMESVKSIDGYNCYRSRSPVQVIGTDTFKVS